MKNLIFKLPLLLLIGIFSCTEDGPTHVDKAPAIYGRVVDMQGNPVAGAKVKVMFDVPQGSEVSNGGSDLRIVSYPNPFDHMVNIDFDVPKSEVTTLKLSRFPDTSAIMTFFKNDILSAGTYSLVMNAKNPVDSFETLPNGFYTMHLQLGDSVFTHKMFHQSEITESGAWVTTDVNGRFILDYKYFPQAGERTPRIFENGTLGKDIIFNDSATIYIVKLSVGSATQKLKIDKNLITEKTFTIQ